MRARLPTCANLIAVRKTMPAATVPALIQVMAQRGLISAGTRLAPSTLYLIAFIDDHSRLVPYAQFYLPENLTAFLDAFEKALLRRGLPRKLYTDNASAFRSKHLEHTTASLGIALVHARPYLPQGKGKIERFFRRVRTI